MGMQKYTRDKLLGSFCRGNRVSRYVLAGTTQKSLRRGVEFLRMLLPLWKGLVSKAGGTR